MSRFFEQVSSSDEESSEEEIEQPKFDAKHVQYSSESEEEEKRVVRSAKDKRFDEMNTIVRNMRNHIKIKDMAHILQDFEDLVKTFDKSKKVIEDSGKGTPKFYVRCIADLEDFVNESWENRKAMNKVTTKSLGILRQRIKKYNREFEDNIKEYKANPDTYDDEPDVEEVAKEEAKESRTVSESVEDGGTFVPVKSKKVVDKDEESDSDDLDWGSSSSDSTSSSDDEAYRLDPASRFLKKTDDKKDKAKNKDKEKDKEVRRQIKEKERAKKREEWTAVEGREKARVFEKGQEISAEVVKKKLSEIVANRGKRGTDRNEQVGQLAEVEAKIVENDLGVALRVKVLFHLTSAVFDQNMNLASSLSMDIWNKNIANIYTLLGLLEFHVEDLTVHEDITEEMENFATPPYKLNGCIMTLVERMDDEYTKVLQNVDPHSVEYVERLRDEVQVCELIDRLCIYLEKKKSNTADLCRAYLRKVEHLYYKFDYGWARSVEKGDNTETSAQSFQQMEKYCHFIYANDDTARIRTRAILCHIYYLALHDYWFKSRDLMLMSNLQNSIEHADIPTMILYNRAMVQLGLCAFRKGFIRESHQFLVDMQSSGRAKELLAQGVIPTRIERTPEQEKMERRRQVPYHMHINLELLECVYLVSALLNEISFIAAHEMDPRRRMISKNFHHVLKISERQALVGPPETMREHIVAASKMMRNGDWKSTVNFIINDKMNAKVWDLFFQSEKVKVLLVQKMKEEALRVYLFTYSSEYESISLDRLSTQFDLEKAVVHSIVSKMIINEELMASLDEPTQCMIMHKTEPTRLQLLALQLSEKVNMLADHNERLADQKMSLQQPQKGGYQQTSSNRNYNPNHSNQQQSAPRRQNQRYYSNQQGGKREY